MKCHKPIFDLAVYPIFFTDFGWEENWVSLEKMKKLSDLCNLDSFPHPFPTHRNVWCLMNWSKKILGSTVFCFYFDFVISFRKSYDSNATLLTSSFALFVAYTFWLKTTERQQAKWLTFSMLSQPFLDEDVSIVFMLFHATSDCI